MKSESRWAFPYLIVLILSAMALSWWILNLRWDVLELRRQVRRNLDLTGETIGRVGNLQQYVISHHSPEPLYVAPRSMITSMGLEVSGVTTTSEVLFSETDAKYDIGTPTILDPGGIQPIEEAGS